MTPKDLNFEWERLRPHYHEKGRIFCSITELEKPLYKSTILA